MKHYPPAICHISLWWAINGTCISSVASFPATIHEKADHRSKLSDLHFSISSSTLRLKVLVSRPCHWQVTALMQKPSERRPTERQTVMGTGGNLSLLLRNKHIIRRQRASWMMNWNASVCQIYGNSPIRQQIHKPNPQRSCRCLWESWQEKMHKHENSNQVHLKWRHTNTQEVTSAGE